MFKPTKKITLIILLLVVIAGVSLFFLAKSIWKPTEQKKEYTETNVIENLIIEDNKTSIKISGTDNNAPVHVAYSERKQHKYTIEQQGTNLLIKKRPDKAKSIQFSFEFTSDDSLMIEVPKNSLKKLSATTSHSGITIKNIQADTGKLKTSNDGIEIVDSIFDNLAGKTTHGTIDIQNTVLGQGNLTTTNEAVGIKNVTVNQSLSLATTHGKISGTLNGMKKDFSIHSDTSHGSNNLGEQPNNAGKRLNFQTTNEDISVQFEK